MATVSVNPPKTPVTEGSNGIAAATLPNVCKMPGPPAPFVPVPLPNIGRSALSPQGYSQTVTIEGHKVAIKGATFKSMGDVASQGTGGGLISSSVEGVTSFVGPGSLDVQIEGKNVHLLGDPMLNNGAGSGTPPNAATMLGLIQGALPMIVVEVRICPRCNKVHGPFPETEATRLDAGELAGNFRLELAKVSADPSAMLGVVACRCKKKFADQNRVTTIELCKAAYTSKMQHAEETELSAAEKNKIEKAKVESRGDKVERMRQSMRNSSEFQDALDDADRAIKASFAGLGSTAYPLGNCAAQKVLLLVRENGGLPAAMTERWYASQPVESPITYIKVHEDGTREPDAKRFEPGASVPPCKTCVILIPFLICPDGQAECNHPAGEVQCKHKT
jgi:hypothetical protein